MSKFKTLVQPVLSTILRLCCLVRVVSELVIRCLPSIRGIRFQLLTNRQGFPKSAYLFISQMPSRYIYLPTRMIHLLSLKRSSHLAFPVSSPPPLECYPILLCPFKIHIFLTSTFSISSTKCSLFLGLNYLFLP